MTLRILHTADWQLGKPFHNVPGDAGALLREAARQAGVSASLVQGKMFVIPRTGEKENGAVLIEYDGRAGEYETPVPCRDLLTGETFAKQVPVAPYQVRVLQNIGWDTGKEA